MNVDSDEEAEDGEFRACVTMLAQSTSSSTTMQLSGMVTNAVSKASSESILDRSSL